MHLKPVTLLNHPQESFQSLLKSPKVNKSTSTARSFHYLVTKFNVPPEKARKLLGGVVVQKENPYHDEQGRFASAEHTNVPEEWKDKKVEFSLDRKEHGVKEGFSLTGPVYLPIKYLVKSQEYTDKNYVSKLEKKIHNGNVRAIDVRSFGGKLYVSDGHHHLQAAQNLGYKTMPAVVISPSQKQEIVKKRKSFLEILGIR